MSQSFFLRRLSRSPTLRVVMALAWLLMTVSLPDMSAASTVADAQGTHTNVAHAVMMDHAMQAHAPATGVHHADHCCGGTAHPVCHCEAMCGSLLLPSVPSLPRLAFLASVRMPVHRLDAPTPNLVPPLRPPAV